MTARELRGRDVVLQLGVRGHGHRLHRARPRVDRYERAAEAGLVGQPAGTVDRIVGLRLQVRVLGRVDLKAAAQHLLLACLRCRAEARIVQQALLHFVRPDVVRLQHRRVVDRRERLRVRRDALLRRDVTLVEHPLQHERTPLLRGVGVRERVIVSGTADDAGEERRLSERDLVEPLRPVVRARISDEEEAPHCRFDAVGTLAQ